ncbi:MAG: tyrosine-type recombinase/integrase [Ktedonobacteraceae bacterium]
MTTNRTPPKKKAKELATLLQTERPDYLYLKSVFRELRAELSIAIPHKEVWLPELPTEDEIRRFYQAVWNCRNFADMVLIKTLFYTGVRVSELVAIRLDEVDVERCQIRITQGKGSKDRLVPFPHSFREFLALHREQMRTRGATYLFESVRKRQYTDRGVRKMLARYATQASITRSMSPHKWRHFLFTWLKKEGIDDALIQPYSGHATRQSLEIYSKLSLADAQPSYNQAMERFPIQ